MENKVIEKLKQYKQVLLVGPYPPPLGGVSVYIYRLSHILKNSRVFNLSIKQKFKGEKYFKLLFLILRKDFDAIYIHRYDIKLIIILKFLKFFRSFDIIATSHNPRLFETNSIIRRIICKSFFKDLKSLVVVGSHILADYKQRNINIPKDVIIEPAFLPPPLEDEDRILKTYPKDLFLFLNKHKPLIIANAFKIVFYKGIDLYGLDMCIELTARLKNDYPNIGFIFALADENENREYLEKMRKRIEELEIEENFYFLTGQKEIWPLFKRVDLMIRPTFSDGYGISIAEAIYFNCPAIASDVCERPEGTILFKNRDLDDLYKKSLKILQGV